MIDIYTDGSFANGNYAWAFVAYKKGLEFYRDFGLGKNEEAKSMRQFAGVGNRTQKHRQMYFIVV